MHFHGLPERLLGSRTRISVLKTLLGTPGAEWTGRELARAAGVSPTQAMDALRAFEAEGICAQRRIGRASVWTLVDRHFLAKALAPIARLDRDAQERLERSIGAALEGSGALEAYIFGSVAAGREEASSDIDLLVVFPDQRRVEAWRRRLDSLRLALQGDFASFLSPAIFTRAQAQRGSAKRLVREARRKGLVVEVGP